MFGGILKCILASLITEKVSSTIKTRDRTPCNFPQNHRFQYLSTVDHRASLL